MSYWEVFISESALKNLQFTLQNYNVVQLGNATLGSVIANFIGNDSSDIWGYMDIGIKQFLNAYSYKYYGLCVIVSTFDGRVAYDSSSSNNSFDNYVNGTIGPNYNTNPHAMKALLNTDGNGYVYTFNSRTNKYVGYDSLRIGSSDYPIGCTTVSYYVSNGNA